MRKNILWATVLALAFLLTAEIAPIPLSNHIRQVNALLCEAMQREGVEGAVADCQKELDRFAGMNRVNNSLLIYERSKACLNRLQKKTRSADILAASTRDICSFESLRGR